MSYATAINYREHASSRSRPKPLKLPSMPNLNRLQQVPMSPDLSERGPKGIRQKIRKGISQVRSYVRSQIYHSETMASPVTEYPQRLDQEPLEKNVVEDYHVQEMQITNLPSTSFNSLRRKLSQKVLSTLNTGTVVVKPELRRPPSIQTLLSLHSSGRASPLQLADTPPTSEGTVNTGSPGSIRRHETTPSSIHRHDLDLLAADSQVFPFVDHITARKLSTIHETDKQQLSTVKVIEATAAAKIHLETHYAAVLREHTPRDVRREVLEQRLAAMRLPPYLKHRVRRAWEQSDSEVLRRNRALAAGKSPAEAYQVVKVLGKLSSPQSAQQDC